MSEPPAKRHDAGNTGKLAVGFIGGGQMCEALVGGLIKQGKAEPSMVIISEPLAERRKYLEDTYHVKTTESNSKAALVGRDGIVILAVKPQVAAVALSGLDLGNDSPLFISIMAGVTLGKLADMGLKRVARTMPNVAALVGCAATGFTLGPGAMPSDADTVERVMAAVGLCVRVTDEKLLDAVTGLSGSGPGYVYMLIESMSDAGVKNGLPRDVATKLAVQTVLGGAKMAIENPHKHPAALRNMVESPGGTTIAGTAALESGGFRASVIGAVTAATDRARELGKL